MASSLQEEANLEDDRPARPHHLPGPPGLEHLHRRDLRQVGEEGHPQAVCGPAPLVVAVEQRAGGVREVRLGAKELDSAVAASGARPVHVRDRDAQVYGVEAHVHVQDNAGLLVDVVREVELQSAEVLLVVHGDRADVPAVLLLGAAAGQAEAACAALLLLQDLVLEKHSPVFALLGLPGELEPLHRALLAVPAGGWDVEPLPRVLADKLVRDEVRGGAGLQALLAAPPGAGEPDLLCGGVADPWPGDVGAMGALRQAVAAPPAE
mmetsp:Transcript_1284/g.3482  ORF Transcript_1284/g.3482 Transcript_1284/m.3482 type:complete len:265 (+) Transcript_1284:97-891(+)